MVLLDRAPFFFIACFAAIDRLGLELSFQEVPFRGP